MIVSSAFRRMYGASSRIQGVWVHVHHRQHYGHIRGTGKFLSSASGKDGGEESQLPENYGGIESQTVQFSQSRTRDFAGQAFVIQEEPGVVDTPVPSQPSDDHVESYDSHGNVSLNAVMQTNVPQPYMRAPSHLNMPGGQSQQGQKFLSGDLQDTHYNQQQDKREMSTWIRKSLGTCSLWNERPTLPVESLAPVTRAALSGGSSQKNISPEPSSKPNQRERLKRAVKEYGGTVIVFHVAIALVSLGGFYIAVSSGLDVVALLKLLGVGEAVVQSKIAAGASTFVLAYAIHKVFAPLRIAITLTSVPFIVRYLRRVGFLKPPKSSSS